MSGLPPASARNHASVDNYLFHNAPLSKVDQELFKEDADFAALVDPKEAVSLDGFIEDCLSMVPCKATKVSQYFSLSVTCQGVRSTSKGQAGCRQKCARLQHRLSSHDLLWPCRLDAFA